MVGDIFRPGRSLLHRFDPRAKLVVLLLLLVVFFLPLRVLALLGYLMFVALLCGVALGIRDLRSPVAGILPILVLVLLLTPPLTGGGRTLVSIGGVILVTTAGLQEAARLIVRFTGITIAFYLFFRTTEPEHIVLSFRWFGLPFAACLIVTITLRYIPYLAAVYGNVTDAHRLRRDSNAGSTGLRVFARLRSLLPILTSVLIYAVKRIPVLSMTLESRGVGRAGLRTDYLQLARGRALAAHALAGLGVCIAIYLPLLISRLW